MKQDKYKKKSARREFDFWRIRSFLRIKANSEGTANEEARFGGFGKMGNFDAEKKIDVLY